MCNRYSPSDREDPHFKTWLAINPTNYPPGSWRKIGPWQTGPFFSNAAGERVDWKVGQWGLIRPGNPQRWDEKAPSKNAKPGTKPIRFQTNNARSETMATSRTFKDAWASDRRCIIPAAAFDEPCWETKKAVWWEFARADGKPWGVAGLWNDWTDPTTGEVVPNYTMVTVNADQHPLMSRMHRPEYESDGVTLKVPQDKRGILVLEPDDWGAWLFGTKEDALGLLRLPPAEVYAGAPVATVPKLPEAPESVRKQLNPPEQGGLF
jgi:putative SOS response-associated peptidase YedK